MAKITLTDVGSGYQSASRQNANNDSIEDHLNNKVLYRDNPDGEANTMQQELDMNSNSILNADTVQANSVQIAGQAIVPGDTLVIDTAATVPFVPAGGIAAVNVQAAIEELDSEVMHLTGAEAASGNKTFNNDVIITGTLDANGNADVAGTLDVTGITTTQVTDIQDESYHQDIAKFASRIVTKKGTDVASATSLAPAGDGNFYDVTGNTNIQAIQTQGGGLFAVQNGSYLKLRFISNPLLSHHATFLILPGGADIQAEAGDIAEFYEYATGSWVMTSYQRASTPPDAITTGTWTPIIMDSALNPGLGQTYSAQNGTYMKIGRSVWYQGRVALSSKGSMTPAFSVVLGGLPFTSSGVVNERGNVAISKAANMIITAGDAVSGYVMNNATYAYLQNWTVATGTQDLTVAEINNTFDIFFTGYYLTA